MVGTGDGEPEEIFRVADTSIWPLITAFGTVGIFASELMKLRWGAFVSAGVIVVAVLMWNRPRPAPMTDEEEEAFEQEHGVPVRASGSLVVPRWGTAIAGMFVTIVFGSFTLGYFYLRLENDEWPPPGFELPSLLPAALAAAAYAVVPVAVRAGRRALLAERQGGLVAGLAVGTAAGAAACTILGYDLATSGFGVAEHAYASIFHTMGRFAVVLASIGIVMSGSTLVFAVRGHFSARRFSHVDNVARLCTGTSVLSILTIGVIYVAPYLTS